MCNCAIWRMILSWLYGFVNWQVLCACVCRGVFYSALIKLLTAVTAAIAHPYTLFTISFVACSCTDKAWGLSKYCTMAMKQWTVPIPPLSLTLTPTAALLWVSTVCVYVKKWLALLVFFITVNTTDTPAPIPFILISILDDKPPQSHSLSLHLHPSIHTPPAWCRLSPKPQRGSNSALLFAFLPSSFLAPSPCHGRCWLAGTEACLDRNA